MKVVRPVVRYGTVMSMRVPLLLSPSTRVVGVRSARTGAAVPASRARASTPLTHRHWVIMLPPHLGDSPPYAGRLFKSSMPRQQASSLRFEDGLQPPQRLGGFRI